MQISAGSRVRKEHRPLGAEPTLAAGRDQFVLHLTQRLKKQGPTTCRLQWASERAGIGTENPAVKETDGAQLQGNLGKFCIRVSNSLAKNVSCTNLERRKAEDKVNGRKWGQKQTWGVPTNP